MRFIDASVFVHAYLRPKRQLSQTELDIKAGAQRIVAKVNGGERTLTTVVHLAEVANILEDNLPPDSAISIEEALAFKDTLVVAPVTREDCFAAVSEMRERTVGLSDALAYVAMKKNSVAEVYSFDRDFDKFDGIRRVTA